ncbi:MAG TPA: DUF4129 domain-containing protein [Gemmatimonadaceae bacterium]|nr:DUF4129 domain-containing protein [Gemmatimonadaceae bacterium]
MTVQQMPVGEAVTVWPRVAIHDTVAAVVKQAAYHREFTRSLFDRMLQWIGEMLTRLFQTLGGVPHGRVVATIAAAVVVTLVVARVVYAARLRTTPAESAVLHGGRVTSASDPWRSAEDLAAVGRFTEAAHALYRATLGVLATRGQIRLHASKTTGDYVRELRRRSAPTHAPFRRFGRRYDRIIYGTGTCDAAEYAALLDDARTVSSARESERAA